MRTTLTLEPDVAADLERLRREGDRSYKDLVDELLRLGLRAMGEEDAARRESRSAPERPTSGSP